MSTDTKDSSKKEQLQNQLTSAMMGAFDTVKKSKDKQYTSPETSENTDNIDKIISKCGTINAAISAGAGLVPGPWGMLAAVPEITLIIKNQIGMVYDIGKAYGKENAELSTELLVGIFASASGAAGIGLITVHGGKLLVKRTSLRVLQKIITMLGGKVTQKLLKSMVAKWLPGIGAAAMAVWSKISTNMIGKKAKEILANEIVIETDMLETSQLQIEEEAKPIVDSELIIKNKIILMANLMKIDSYIAPVELSWITTMIEAVDIADELTFELLDILKSSEKGVVDYALLRESEEALPIMLDMAALAMIDGDFHDFERVYIKPAGKSLGLSDVEIGEVINLG